jgi:hypothetical protein
MDADFIFEQLEDSIALLMNNDTVIGSIYDHDDGIKLCWEDDEEHYEAVITREAVERTGRLTEDNALLVEVTFFPNDCTLVDEVRLKPLVRSPFESEPPEQHG